MSIGRCLAAVLVVLFAASARAQKREVLVYLANEPAPTLREGENIGRIVGWLQGSSSEDDRVLAAGILNDLRSFPAQVDSDVAAIGGHSNSLSGVLVATNRLLQSGAVLVSSAGEVLHRLPFSVTVPRDGREASNPLSSAANLSRVLELAASTFPPHDYDFVVVVESHGDEVYAVTPRLGLPTEGLTEEILINRVHGSDNAFVERYGITTAALLDLLVDQRRKRDFRTTLLVLASCESSIEEQPPEIPLALVAAHGLPLLFGVIDYEKVLTTSAPTLREAFVSVLTPAPFEIADPSAVVHRRWMERRERLLAVLPYFGPLAVWLGAFAWLRRSRARQSRTHRSGV